MNRIPLPVVLPRLADLEPRFTELYPGYSYERANLVYTFDERDGAPVAVIGASGTYNYDRRMGNVRSHIPVAAPTPEALADAIRYRIGQKAAHRLWNEWMEQMDAEGRQNRTVATLLAIPAGRKACLAALAAGKSYTQDAEAFATRRIVRAAVQTLTDRATRRKARHVAEAARIGAPNRIGIRFTQDRVEAETKRRASLVSQIKGILLPAANYRTATNGHTETVVLCGPGQSPAVISDTGSDRRIYGGAFKGWAATTSSHTYRVRETWLTEVSDRDLESCDGMVTLDAEPILGHGPELFRATWVEQSRGTSLSTVTGYIARSGDTTYHAASARAALDGLARKLGTKPSRRKPVIDLDRWARVAGDTPVYFADSTDAGNCESGTRSWCHAVGIDTRESTLADVIRAYKLRPLPEALAVIRRVIRDRHNRTPFTPVDLSQLNGAAQLLDDGRIVFDSEGGFRVERN